MDLKQDSGSCFSMVKITPSGPSRRHRIKKIYGKFHGRSCIDSYRQLKLLSEPKAH